jgi:hypothetical protein
MKNLREEIDRHDLKYSKYGPKAVRLKKELEQLTYMQLRIAMVATMFRPNSFDVLHGDGIS